MEPRRTSSVYSDTFELDDLLLRLTKQADEQHDMVSDILQQENNALYRKLRAARQLWRFIVGLVHGIVELIDQLEELLTMARLRIQQGRANYLANCTAF
ncbi:hypothetical protein CNYM01_14359 [Colletotrichum nymphaeae SA-01]|uniref:Uncharacterized protein n=1 Tax=Colletotrichum nymphaeae SA-01 TaxID=1460502 RepID=A0A135UJ76_9PEZI|nr:hypothetical protein CNYM01_14359 [Colletotrichum nymphaeae SA-01]